MAVTLLILNRFPKFFSLSDSPVHLQQSTLLTISSHLTTLPCGILTSESVQQSQTNAVINDKVQGAVAT